MPAYGKNLSPAETTALVAFLQNATSGGTGAGAGRSEPWHSEEAGRILPRCVLESPMDTCNPIRVRTMVHLRPSYVCPVSCGMGLLARLVASTEYDSKPDFGLAACRFHEWDVCTVDCLGFAAGERFTMSSSRSIWWTMFY